MPDAETTSDVAELAAAVRELIASIDERKWARWLSVDGATEYTSLCDKSIRNLISAGKLTPSRAVRGRLLIDRNQLDALLLSECGKRPRKGRGIRQ